MSKDKSNEIINARLNSMRKNYYFNSKKYKIEFTEISRRTFYLYINDYIYEPDIRIYKLFLNKNINLSGSIRIEKGITLYEDYNNIIEFCLSHVGVSDKYYGIINLLTNNLTIKLNEYEIKNIDCVIKNTNIFNDVIDCKYKLNETIYNSTNKHDKLLVYSATGNIKELKLLLKKYKKEPKK